jgi:Fe-S cluster biogenesis protein NfuA
MSAAVQQIERVLHGVLAPLLRADGGELYLVRLEEAGVDLHLAGRLAGCPGNALIYRRIIEPAIHAVLPEAQVTVTWGILIPPAARRIECEEDKQARP